MCHNYRSQTQHLALPFDGTMIVIAWNWSDNQVFWPCQQFLCHSLAATGHSVSNLSTKKWIFHKKNIEISSTLRSDAKTPTSESIVKELNAGRYTNIVRTVQRIKADIRRLLRSRCRIWSIFWTVRMERIQARPIGVCFTNSSLKQEKTLIVSRHTYLYICIFLIQTGQYFSGDTNFQKIINPCLYNEEAHVSLFLHSKSSLYIYFT